MRADIHDLWEVYWHKTLETKGKWLANLIECIPNRPWFEKFSFRSRKFYSTLSRLRLGHFRLKTHLYRINLADDPLCDFCNSGSPQDLHHIIFNCSHLSLQRMLLVHDLQVKFVDQTLPNSVDVMLRDDRTYVALYKFISNINI